MSLIHVSDRIFIAGARGMAGSAISRALMTRGYTNQLTPERSELDLLDGTAVQKWMKTHQPDVVVLAAAKVGGIQANNSQPAGFLLDNLKIETHVIETAWNNCVRRLLFLGSSCIYPKFAPQPIREEALLTGALEPTNAWYAIAKICGIKLGEALRKQYDFDAISLMPTNLYGPGDNYHLTESHVLPALIRRFHQAKESNTPSVCCWGTGTPLREFLHADDLGEACVFALENWDPTAADSPRDEVGEPLPFLNVGTGCDISIRELAKQVATTVGYPGQIQWDQSKPDGTPKKQLDVSRLQTMGWQAQISLKKGLELTYADFLDQLSKVMLRG